MLEGAGPSSAPLQKDGGNTIPESLARASSRAQRFACLSVIRYRLFWKDSSRRHLIILSMSVETNDDQRHRTLSVVGEKSIETISGRGGEFGAVRAVAPR